MLHLHPAEPVTVSSDRSLRLHLSERDFRIILLALRKLQGARVDFAEAIRALREAVEETIPTGRIFLLGQSDQGPRVSPSVGPIVGSIISGVGIAESSTGVRLLRVARDGRRTDLGRFAP